MRAEWDKLSALLEDEKAGNDAIRDAAVALCAALEEHRVYPKVSDKCPSCGGMGLEEIAARPRKTEPTLIKVYLETERKKLA